MSDEAIRPKDEEEVEAQLETDPSEDEEPDVEAHGPHVTGPHVTGPHVTGPHVTGPHVT